MLKCKIQQDFRDELRSSTITSKMASHWRVNQKLLKKPTWDTDQIRTFIMQNHHVTISQELVDEVGILIGLIHYLIKDLAIQSVSAKSVSKLPTMKQKKICQEVLQNMLDNRNGNPDVLNIMITCNESQVCKNNPELKVSHHSGEIQCPRDQK